MPVGYKEAFGLSDNPFGPRRQYGTVAPALTLDLQFKPLLLHRDAQLARLYCDKIPSFANACQKMEALLEADAYTANPPGRGVASYLISIEGDRGTGKTTLASRMLQLMTARTPPGDPAWRVEELFLRSKFDTSSEQVDKLKALEARVTAANEQYNCVLVDDLLADAYPYAMQVYDNLTAARVAFFVFTSCDPAMSSQIDKAWHNVQRHRIAALTPDDAISYVNARYRIFRVPVANGINALPLFPFDEQDIRTAVQVRALKGVAATGPVNLRVIASALQGALVQRLQDISADDPNFDVNKAPAAKLTNFVVKVAQSYQALVRR